MDEDEFEFRKIVVSDTFAEVDRLLVHVLTDYTENSRSYQASILRVIINQIRGLRGYMNQSLANTSSEDTNRLLKKHGMQ